MTVGERIRARRKELHMSLDDLSRETGIPKSTIQRWETGAIQNMGQSGLQKVASALKIDIQFLLTGVSVRVREMPDRVTLPTDHFEYLLERCGYSYATHIGPTRYFEKGGRVIATDDRTFNTIMEQFLPYFSFLVQEHSISLLEDFLPLLKAQEPKA